VFNLVFHQSIGRFNPFDSSIDISYAYHHSGSFCTHLLVKVGTLCLFL